MQDRPEGASQRHHLGHGGDAGPPGHPHGEQGGQRQAPPRTQPAQVPTQAQEHGGRT
jgi:hypothetical protein